MYCKNCGQMLAENSEYCTYCGTRVYNTQTSNINDDKPSLGFAVLSFFMPIVGLILFLVYRNDKPKKAKSAGKGALIGIITKIVISIIVTIIYVVFCVFLFNTQVANDELNTLSDISSGILNNNTDEILKNDLDVTFGKFKVSGDEELADTSLDVTVKNKSAKKCSFFITIEAIDDQGRRIDSDIVSVNSLRPEQEAKLTAFEFVEEKLINQFKKAHFRVLDVKMFDY